MIFESIKIVVVSYQYQVEEHRIQFGSHPFDMNMLEYLFHEHNEFQRHRLKELAEEETLELSFPQRTDFDHTDVV